MMNRKAKDMQEISRQDEQQRQTSVITLGHLKVFVCEDCGVSLFSNTQWGVCVWGKRDNGQL